MTRDRSFIDWLIGFARRRETDPNARAALAILRRGLGKELGTAPEMYPYVVPFLQGTKDEPAVRDDREEGRYYLIASLFALHASSLVPPSDPPRNLGASFYLLHRAIPDRDRGQSMDRRFTALLACDGDALTTQLRYAVQLLADIPIDWYALFDDIRRWEYQRNPVQRAWARAYYRDRPDVAAISDPKFETEIP